MILVYKPLRLMCFDSHLPKLYFGVDHGQNAVIE